MARGHRLNTSIVLAAVHGLSGLFRAVSAVEPSFFRPLPPPPNPHPLPVPNKPPRFCGRKAKWSSTVSGTTDQSRHGLQADDVVLEVAPVVEGRGLHEVGGVPLVPFQQVERVEVVPPVSVQHQVNITQLPANVHSDRV